MVRLLSELTNVLNPCPVHLCVFLVFFLRYEVVMIVCVCVCVCVVVFRV
jgi:hypothetical protein